MGIRVLGPLEVDEGLLSPRERTVLSVLVLRAGTSARIDELADALWPRETPSTWPKQVQATIARLRRSLGNRAIRTGAGGYAIDIDPESIDATRFERLVASARARAVDDDPGRAIDAFERAVALWRSTPYPDLAAWPDGAAESRRLVEVHSAAEEELAIERLRAGAHRSVVPEAERLVREAPLREARWVILATALYRSGRQADALSAIRTAREKLGSELGIDLGEELTAVELAILRHDASLVAPDTAVQADLECPYRGLQPFGIDDAGEFYGRDGDIEAVLARLARSSFLAVSGSSGSVKSSLVRAGLVPALVRRGAASIVLIPSASTAATVRDAITGRAHADVIVLDQFEELLHGQVPPEQVHDVCRALVEAMDAGRTVVIVVRSDFLDDCAREPSIGPFFAEGVHLVGPLTPAALRQVVEEPASRAGLRLEPGLVELILRDASGEIGALPLVSHALVETWLRREGTTLTVDGYEAAGGISGAIAQSADRMYQSMEADEQALCRSTLIRLISLAPDGSPVRRRIPSRSVRADPARDHILAKLAQARLVSAEASSIVIAHESIATAWPRLHGWLEQDAEHARMLAALTIAADAWDEEGRPDDDLFRGARLQTALEWRTERRPDLTDVEQAFLAASSERARSEVDALEAQAHREIRSARRLRGLLAGALVLLVVAGAATGVASMNAQRATESAEDASIESLVSSALALMSSDRETGALLAAEAYRRWPEDPRSRVALMGAMTAADGYVGRLYLDGTVRISGDLIPGTRQAFVVRDGSRPATTTDRRGATRVSEDGRIGVTASAGSAGGCCALEVTAFDLATGERRFDPTVVEGGLHDQFALSPSGETAYFVDFMTGDVQAVDTRTGDSPTIDMFTGAENSPVSLPAVIGDRVAVASATALAIADPSGAAPTRSIPIPEGAGGINLLPVGDGTVIASGDGGVARVDAASGDVLWLAPAVRMRMQPCVWLTISTERETFYCADFVGPVTELSLESGQPTGRSFDGQLGSSGDLRLLDDGNELVVIGAESPSIATWRLDGGGAAAALVAEGQYVMGGIEPLGTLLFAARRPEQLTPNWSDGARIISIWDPDTGRSIFDVPDDVLVTEWAGPGELALTRADRTEVLTLRTGETHEIAHRDWRFLDASRTSGVTYAITLDGIARFDSDTGLVDDVRIRVPGEFVSLTDTPDGSHVAVRYWAPEDDLLRVSVFEASTGREIAAGLDRHAGAVITPGMQVISSSFDGLRISSLPDLDLVQTLPKSLAPGPRLQISTDGRTLLVPSFNDSVTLYDLPSGSKLGGPVPADLNESITGFLQPDGLAFVVNGSDGVVRWTLDPSDHLEAACRMAGRELTDSEWATHLGSLGPQRATCAEVLG